MKEKITQQRLKEVLIYDGITGNFINKFSRGRARKGEISGSINQYGYRTIRVDYNDYLAHRLTWLFHCGVFPQKELDHINRNPLDNHIENLRESTGSQNHANIKKRDGLTSKYKGVSWNKFRNKWKASITVKGKARHIGLFLNEQDAHDAYCREAKKEFGEFHYAG